MEEIAIQVTINVSHAVEIMAAVIIGIALVRLTIYSVSALPFTPKVAASLLRAGIGRLSFGSSVAVALELLLAADVLATAVAPSWNDIGQLAAIATIRTALNYFLEKELKHANRQARINERVKNSE